MQTFVTKCIASAGGGSGRGGVHASAAGNMNILHIVFAFLPTQSSPSLWAVICDPPGSPGRNLTEETPALPGAAGPRVGFSWEMASPTIVVTENALSQGHSEDWM